MLAQLEPHWFVLSETTSTNIYARQILQHDGHEPPFVVFAKHQTAGIGQRGKIWLSQANASITASVVVPAGCIPLGMAPIMAGLGILESIVFAIPTWLEPPTKTLSLQLKWPNDILLNGCKLGGILCERVGKAFIIGVGLNLWPNAYDEPQSPSTSAAPTIPPTALFEHCQTLARTHSNAALDVAQMIFSRFWAYWQMHSNPNEFSHQTICDSFAKVDALMNKPLDLWQNGKLMGQGLGKGLNLDGRYCIQVGDQDTLWHSGELSIRSQCHVV